MKPRKLRWRWVTALLLLVGSGARAADNSCTFFSETYARQVKRRVESGVPFELMSLVTRNDELVDRQVVRVEYDLWDERVQLTDLDGTLTQVKLPEAEQRLCRLLAPRVERLARGHTHTHRVLLNPNWEGRAKRLQERLERLEASEGAKLLDVDWQRISAAMPRDSILVVREVTP